MHDVALAHSRLVPGSFVVEIDLFEAGETTHDVDDAVAAVIACTDDDAAGVQVREHSVEGGEAGGVG